MPFDPEVFEAEVALGMIPTERLPASAQDALEAGYDGRHVVRMAILDPKDGYEIHEVLPKMLAELGRGTPSREDAALWLARRRARQILDSGEDPLPSLAWFYQVMLNSGHPRELVELGYLEDEFYLIADPAEQRAMAIAALEALLDPELCARRNAEALAVGQERQREMQEDWP